MPWKSVQQQKWGNSSAGVKAMGTAKVHEFNEATKSAGGFKKLPKRAPKPKKK